MNNALLKTIEPRSDQLNFDDLIHSDKVITVTEVRVHASTEQPLSIHYQGDDGRPYKPCKSMRRVLIAAWGPRSEAWVGRSMRLYGDPSIRFGKDAVGGIRISHLTDIDGPKSYMLTVTRSRRAEYRVQPMDRAELPPYPDDLFEQKLPAIRSTIEAGTMTAEQAIARLQQTGTLTESQRATVRAITTKEST